MDNLPKNKRDKAAAFTKPPSCSLSESQNSLQGDSRPTLRLLKHSAPEQQILKKSQSPPNNTDQRATRWRRRSQREPLDPVDANQSSGEPVEIINIPSSAVDQTQTQNDVSNEVQNAVKCAAEKLELHDEIQKPPPSSKTDSSIQSTSFDDANTESPLSSPPPETPGLSPTQRNIEYVHNAILDSDLIRSSRCPLCKDRIDDEFYKSHFGGEERLTMRQQTNICKAHKKHQAELQWKEQQYPKIDWQRMDERLKQYHNDLDLMLQGRKFSFYRNAFEDIIKTRKDRTFRKDLLNGKDLEGSTAGYYGSRGARIMYEIFFKDLKERFADHTQD